jgi:hypothetical protein
VAPVLPPITVVVMHTVNLFEFTIRLSNLVENLSDFKDAVESYLRKYLIPRSSDAVVQVTLKLLGNDVNPTPNRRKLSGNDDKVHLLKNDASSSFDLGGTVTCRESFGVSIGQVNEMLVLALSNDRNDLQSFLHVFSLRSRSC